MIKERIKTKRLEYTKTKTVMKFKTATRKEKMLKIVSILKLSILIWFYSQFI